MLLGDLVLCRDGIHLAAAQIQILSGQQIRTLHRQVIAGVQADVVADAVRAADGLGDIYTRLALYCRLTGFPSPDLTFRPGNLSCLAGE